jgi:prevent-host-death family protein
VFRVVEGDTKSGKPRVIDLDEDTVSVLRTHRKARRAMALQLVAPGSLVFGDLEGAHRDPEHVSRQFTRDAERCGEVPGVRLHHLRHVIIGPSGRRSMAVAAAVRIRAVMSEGPQVITRYGEDVAVVVDIGEYRRLTRPAVDLASILLGGPKFDGTADVFAEIEAERKTDFGRAVDLEAGM